jgi:nitrite reductase (NADH) small subunit
MVGDIDDRLVVASPLYKQHFDLLTGECLENDEVSVAAHAVTIVADQVLLSL